MWNPFRALCRIKKKEKKSTLGAWYSMTSMLPQHYKRPHHLNVDFNNIVPMDPNGRTYVVLVASQRKPEQFDLFYQAFLSANDVARRGKGKLVVVNNDSSTIEYGNWQREVLDEKDPLIVLINPIVAVPMLPEAARRLGVDQLSPQPGDTIVLASDDCQFGPEWHDALKDSQGHESFHYLVSHCWALEWPGEEQTLQGFSGAGLAMSYDTWQKAWLAYQPPEDRNVARQTEAARSMGGYVTSILWESSFCYANMGKLSDEHFIHKCMVAVESLGRTEEYKASIKWLEMEWAAESPAIPMETTKIRERAPTKEMDSHTTSECAYDPFKALADRIDREANPGVGLLAVTHRTEVNMDRPDFADFVAPGDPAPKVSILMPSLNQGQFISEALQSVVDQTEEDWELLVVDGGSQDRTKKVVSAFQKSDDRIKWVDAPGTTTGQARNHGLALARGKYIALLDTDDWYFPHSLASRIQAMEAMPCSMVYTKADGAPVAAPDEFDLNSFLTANFIPCQSVMMRRDVAAIVGGCNPNLRVGEDWEWWMRIMAVAGAPKFLDDTTYHVRQHQGSLTYRDLTQNREQTLKALEDLRTQGRTYFELMREPVSVLLLAPSLVHGGAGTFLKDLCHHPILQRFGMNIAANMYGPIAAEFADIAGLQCFKINEALSKKPFPYHVIHAQYWGPVSFEPCLPALQVPGLHLVTDHGESGMDPQLLGPVHRCVHVYHRRDHTDVAPQNSYFPQHLYIPSGVGPGPEESNRFDLPANKKIVLTVSRCVDEKNPEMFFRMADHLSIEHPGEYVYVFLGYEEGAPMGADCAIMASQLRSKGEDVRLVPCVSHKEAVQYIQCANVFVLLSATEAMPRALLEAIEAGKPCVATAVGSVPKILPAECLVARRHEPEQAAELVEKALTGQLAPVDLDPAYSMGNVAWLYALLYRSHALMSRLAYRARKAE